MTTLVQRDFYPDLDTLDNHQRYELWKRDVYDPFVASSPPETVTKAHGVTLRHSVAEVPRGWVWTLVVEFANGEGAWDAPHGPYASRADCEAGLARQFEQVKRCWADQLSGHDLRLAVTDPRPSA